MTQRRSIIPILGVILYLGIIIGAATDGKPGFLIGTAGTALILCIGYLCQKKRIRGQETINTKVHKSQFFLNDSILYYIAGYIVVALTLYFGAKFNNSVTDENSSMLTLNLSILLIVFCIHILILFLRSKISDKQ